MRVVLDGTRIRSDADFHTEIADLLDFPGYYGRNLDALWDVFRDIPRPMQLIWENSSIARNAMPSRFAQIVSLLEDVKKEDASQGLTDRFQFELH